MNENITKEVLMREGFIYDENLSKWYLKRNNIYVAPEIYQDKLGFYIDCIKYPGLSVSDNEYRRYIKTIDDLNSCFSEAYVVEELKNKKR